MQSLPKLLEQSLVEALAVLITSYQKILSPDHGIFGALFGRARCRFYPTCSAYVLATLRQYGLFRGAVFSLKRVLCCNPGSRGGYDPVRNIAREKFQRNFSRGQNSGRRV